MRDQLVFVAAAGFEAARRVEILPAGHRSRRVHGHSFVAKVRAGVSETQARFPGSEVGQLQKRLADCIAPLDYELLNNSIPTPTDENIARWIRSRLDLTEIQTVGIRSTADEGVDLDTSDRAHIWRRYSFQAAHCLPHVAPGHKCGRMHGHGFDVIIHALQDITRRDLGVDYDYIDRVWAPVFSELDRRCLNDIRGLENPTSELISSWIWNRVRSSLPELAWLTVYETPTCGAHFDGRRYRIWKEISLDAAIRHSRAPDGDPRQRIHGHTYTLRLHLDAPLDGHLGWTIDFGDVKASFDPVFRQLDHQPLYEIPGMADNDVATLLRWIKEKSSRSLPAMDRIDLYETPGCGAILHWGAEPPALPI